MMLDWYAFWHFVIIIAYLYAAILIYFFRKSKNLKINIDINAKDLFFTLAMFVILMVLLFIVKSFGLLESHTIEISTLKLILIITYLIIIVAPVEEALFRGVIAFWLVKKTNIFLGWIISAIVFGLAHLPNGASGANLLDWNWKLALIAGVSGLFFGITYLKTKSIINPILLHGLSITVWVLFFEVP